MEGYRTGSLRLERRHAMSGRERASQFPGSHMRRFAAAVGTPDHGAPIRDRSRISRAAFGVGLLIALRVVGEGRSKRAAAEQERSGRESRAVLRSMGSLLAFG